MIPQEINIAVCIPTRGDRLQFLEHAKYLLSRQILQPNYIIIVSYPPVDNKIDLVKRYRIGCEKAFNEYKCDVVVCWEDDDFYSSDYIKVMVGEWEKHNRPVIFGLDSTIYYHIFHKRWRNLKHKGRASMMNTLLTKEALNISWNIDSVFLDLDLWRRLKGVSISYSKIISIGIKHNIGMCAGMGHKKGITFDHLDSDMKFLGGIVDERSLEFYKNPKGANVIKVDKVDGVEKFVKTNFGLTDIIIPTYKNEDYTINCVRSIKDYTKEGTYRIIWIDNGSPESAKIFPILKDVNHTPVLLPKNEGFVGAINKGLEISDAPTVCLLNNDTVVSDRWLEKMVTALYKDPKLGILGCLTAPPAEKERYDSHHNIAYQQKFRKVPVFPKFVNLEDFNKKIEKQLSGVVGEIDFVAFLCAIIKREVINKIGFLDPKYEMGMYDDKDYNLQIQKEGYKVGILLDTCIVHKGRTTFKLIEKEEKFDVNALLKKNKEYLDKKWNIK